MAKNIPEQESGAESEGMTGRKRTLKNYFILPVGILMLAVCLSACGGGDSDDSSGSDSGDSSKWDSMTWDNGTWE